ncbi:MAG: T9SS type A sorting domain-containing protein [Chitinophagales bacterium]
MQKVFTLSLLIVFYFSGFSQIRYLDSVFNFVKHADIQYGSNYDNKNQLTNLLMDVYEPQNDTASALRPIIFFVHGGSFVGGDRGDQQINKTAEFFAKKGYVTANIEYRVQQTTLITPFLDFALASNWYKAIARATQDLKAAVRYIKKDVAINSNSYRVDTNMIFIYGSSAGAIATLHTVFLDDTIEMSVNFKNAYKELGGLDGNSGNSGYTMKGIKAIVSCSGAISDLNFLNNNRDIQYIAFHNNPDLVVPFDVGCFDAVFCHLGQFYGDNKIFPKIKGFGTNAEFYPINHLGHPADQVSDTASHRMILQKTTAFLYRIVSPSTPTAIRNNTVKSIDLYPNPTTGNFTITVPTEIRTKNVLLMITDMTGKTVFSTESNNKETISIDENLPNGLYIISVTSDTQTYLAKLSVMK